MKKNIVNVLVCFLILIPCSSISWSSESSVENFSDIYPNYLRKAIQEENEEVKAFAEGKIGQVVLIRIFGKILAIPNRFVLNSKRFNKHMYSSISDLSGSIIIGPVTDEFIASKSVSTPTLVRNVIRKTNKLTVTKTCQRIRKSNCFVTIYDDKEFLTVGGENKNLWKNILYVYENGVVQ